MKKIHPKRRRLAANRPNPTPKKWVTWAACGTLGLGLTHDSSAATLITFGGFDANNIPISTLPDYGDNVTADSSDYIVSQGLADVVGTPDVTLDWFSQWDTYIDWNGRGNVAQSDFNGGIVASIQFTPSLSSAVRLVSFELDEWAAGGPGSIAWDVSDSSGMRASGIWTMTDAGGRSVIAPGVTGLLGDPLTLNLTLVSGEPSYFALDNLTFDQVPEPSTLILALPAVGLGAAAMRRRRFL